ncbi:cysteine synthase A [Streptomyces sp. CG 926]|uniref:PLP-dependent cysteine synthase family protein n=1 Tax=Streptomyces sp. CG 926 TaxID=1882405 RepID=UPI000D6BA664|nr:PLP-dependent cysteine synthase family protein [Streptomyces sp. CG 926]PWK65086.1 cysteine synthase A [Streptomyces sp. CG 926]
MTELSLPVSPSAAPAPHSVLKAVGNTPVLFIDEPFTPAPRGFWAKLEGFNPGGIKDRAALYMVDTARERGALRPGAPIIESTSGTLGLGLAPAGVLHGHPVHLVTDPGMEPIMERMLTAHGARLHIVDQPHPEGGWQEARRRKVAELLGRHPGAWCPDQYNNPDNVAAYRPLADELTDQLGTVDVLVCAVGTGGHSSGIARRLHESNPALRLVGVDTIGSTIFGQPARPRLMRGLGSSIYPRNVDYPAFSEVHWVAPAEAVWSARRLAARHFATGGWSVGAVALVAGWLARTQPDGTRIAAVFPDGPHRYFDTVFNDEYCRTHQLLGTDPPSAPETVASPLSGEIARWTRCTDVFDPMPAPAAPATARTAGAGR